MTTVDTTCQICKKPLQLKLDIDNLDRPMTEMFMRMAKNQAVHDRCQDGQYISHSTNAIVEEADSRRKQWCEICPAEFVPPIDWSNPKAKRTNFDLIKGWSGPKGLYVHGATGLCKTRFVYKVLGPMYVDSKDIVCMTHSWFRYRITELTQSDHVKLHALVDRIRKADVWFMDDLGNGRFTPASEEAFEMLLNARTSENKPCVFTSLTTPEQLKLTEERNESINRRIRDFCDIIQFTL